MTTSIGKSRARRSLAERSAWRKIPVLLAVALLATGLRIPARAAAADTGASEVTLVVISGVPTLGFYDNELDFHGHSTQDAAEVKRHRTHAMSFSSIPADERQQLQEQLGGQETAAAGSAFPARLGPNTRVLPSDADTAPVFDAAFAGGTTNWRNLAGHQSLDKLFGAGGANAVALVRVDDVCHNEGHFIERKAEAHYYCVDVVAQGRVALADGRLLPIHVSRICTHDEWVPVHTERLDSTSTRQATSLRRAFEQLAARFTEELARVEH